jgi:xanthine dehydrogenase accessory factor
VSILGLGKKAHQRLLSPNETVIYNDRWKEADMLDEPKRTNPGGSLYPGEIYVEMRSRLERGGRAAMATVVKTRGSTPQQEGAKMVVFDDGSFIGTVGGGCVEADIWAEAGEVLRSGRAGIFHFNLAGDFEDDEGMVCGGQMDVLIEPWSLP